MIDYHDIFSIEVFAETQECNKAFLDPPPSYKEVVNNPEKFPKVIQIAEALSWKFNFFICHLSISESWQKF